VIAWISYSGSVLHMIEILLSRGTEHPLKEEWLPARMAWLYWYLTTPL